MFSPGIGDILFKATLLAQRAGASEIGLDTLLGALDAPSVSLLTPELAGEESYFINSDWLPISSEVAEALAPFRGLEEITAEELRRALLLAKAKRGETDRST